MGRSATRMALALVVVGAAIVTTSCSGNTTTAFNDELVELIDEHVARDQTFSGFVKRYLDGRRVDAWAMGDERDKLAKAFAEDLRTVRAMKVPDAKMTKALHKSAVQYIDQGVTLVEKCVEVVTYVSKHPLPTAADVSAVEAMLDAAIYERERRFENMVSRQELLAKKHG